MCMNMDILDKLEAVLEGGFIEPVDLEFARFLKRLDPNAPDILILAGCLASHAVSQSNTCIDIDTLITPDDNPALWAFDILQETPAEELKKNLAASPLVAGPGAQKPAPLVLEDGHRLYLQRYHHHETVLSKTLSRLARRDYALNSAQTKAVQQVLTHFFPDHNRCDHQRVAACTAVIKGLCVVSGGPGTGKTTTVAAILAALKAAHGQIPIALAAPTGKAATRLRQSIESVLMAKDLSMNTNSPFLETFTLHRLLGADGRGRFRYGPGRHLSFEAVIVDEASMVDLPLMARLASGLPPEARLILLGDKDQLSSVEAGNVLNDICSITSRYHYSQDHARKIMSISGDILEQTQDSGLPLRDCIVELKKNFRFGSSSAISALASAICKGEEERALEIITSADPSQTRLLQPKDTPLAVVLARSASSHFLPCLKGKTAEDAISRLHKFRILCAHKDGPFGTSLINRSICAHLIKRPWETGTLFFFKGQPLIVLKNSYRYSIFNGDMCVLWPDENGRLKAWFEMPDGELRTLPLSSLPEKETAFAITVHKSQGSEFDHILVVLPNENSPLLSRQLLYTAVTRAKNTVEIWGTTAAFKKAVQKKTRRLTGLKEKLLLEGR